MRKRAGHGAIAVDFFKDSLYNSVCTELPQLLYKCYLDKLLLIDKGVFFM